MIKKVVILPMLIFLFLAVTIVFIDTLANAPETINYPEEEKTVEETAEEIPQKEEEKPATTLYERKKQECLQERQISSRNNCLIFLVPLAENIELCNIIQGHNDKAVCITEFAKKDQDYAICNSMGSEFGNEEHYGEQLSMAQLCKDEIAHTFSNEEQCTTTNCLYILAQKTKNTEFCDRISHPHHREDCLAKIS